MSSLEKSHTKEVPVFIGNFKPIATGEVARVRTQLDGKQVRALWRRVQPVPDVVWQQIHTETLLTETDDALLGYETRVEETIEDIEETERTDNHYERLVERMFAQRELERAKSEEEEQQEESEEETTGEKKEQIRVIRVFELRPPFIENKNILEKGEKEESTVMQFQSIEPEKQGYELPGTYERRQQFRQTRQSTKGNAPRQRLPQGVPFFSSRGSIIARANIFSPGNWNMKTRFEDISALKRYLRRQGIVVRLRVPMRSFEARVPISGKKVVKTIQKIHSPILHLRLVTLLGVGKRWIGGADAREVRRRGMKMKRLGKSALSGSQVVII